ncbi:Tether containing UBX domain for GLUT4 [Araneus ventricosus]|uniref:Tether containing UBX domain for GLUT4 n=1 Tax=Araneus ventricosus TaxID=182803 RepID=A0A4Y2A8V2_ARAVE|nr:Tether containing UBX domain for GLUT4 [Araneus ventricosus]
MENAVGIPTWNMLKKEDLQNVLGLHSCNIIPTGLLFVMQICNILEEACKKQKINPSDFDIRHYSRILDLSLPIRFANIPNNAQLELQPASRSRADSLVTVALQLESGERITKDFPPSATVYDVLEQSLKSESICVEEIGEPACIYMRQKIIGDAIKSTTLRSLGLTSGKAIIRLLYRNPEVLEEQAHETAPLTAHPPLEIGVWDSRDYKPPDSPVPEQIKKQARLENAAVEQKSSIYQSEGKGNKLDAEIVQQERTEPMDINDNENSSKEEGWPSLDECDDNSSITSFASFQKEENVVENTETDISDQKSSMSCDSETQDDVEEIGEIIYIGGRHAVVYSLDDITEVKKADLPDEFFELTVNEARYLLESYRKERLELENQPLLTKDQRQRQVLDKLAQYKKTVIRVYFPERLVLQAVFQTTETVQDVQDFVRNYLEDRHLNFYLYITPPKEKLNPSKSLIETMLIPAAVIYFGCDIQLPSYLVGNLREKLSDPRAAALAASESRKEIISNAPQETMPQEIVNRPAVESRVNNGNTNATHQPYQPPSQSQGKVPKWLKLNRK